MATIVTKVRDGAGKYGPRYRLLIDGELTELRVEKSVPPRYRAPQLWDVIEGEDPESVLFDATSLEGALGVVRTIAQATHKAEFAARNRPPTADALKGGR